MFNSYCVRNAKLYDTDLLLPEVGCYREVLRGRHIELRVTRSLAIQW